MILFHQQRFFTMLNLNKICVRTTQIANLI